MLLAGRLGQIVDTWHAFLVRGLHTGASRWEIHHVSSFFCSARDDARPPGAHR